MTDPLTYPQITEYGYQRDPVAVRTMMEVTEKVLRKCRGLRQVRLVLCRRYVVSVSPSCMFEWSRRRFNTWKFGGDRGVCFLRVRPIATFTEVARILRLVWDGGGQGGQGRILGSQTVVTIHCAGSDFGDV